MSYTQHRTLTQKPLPDTSMPAVLLKESSLWEGGHCTGLGAQLLTRYHLYISHVLLLPYC